MSESSIELETVNLHLAGDGVATIELNRPQALQWGLINRVVADERLGEEVAELAARLAAGPTRSYAGAKRQLNNWLYPRMAEQLELEAQIQREMAGSEDFVEGAMAFVEKRPARFSGR